jgi:ribosome-binding protein aMBF1 (putative translation factor)
MYPTHSFFCDALYCSACDLVQFVTSSGLCRRCHRKLDCSLINRRKISILPPSGGLSADPLAKRIGATIRSLRKERKLSQARFSASIGVARPVLSRIERGLAVPTLKHLEKITSALGMDLLDLFIRIR